MTYESSLSMKFADKVLRGEKPFLTEHIKEWTEGRVNAAIYDFLGMTHQEWDRFLAGEIAEDIILERNNNVTN